MRRISTTLGQNPPIQGEQGSKDSPPRYSLPFLRGVKRNLSEIISDSAVADPPVAAASMFKTSDPTPIEDIAGGTCELPRASRREDPKTIRKKKDTICAGLNYKYHLNSFQLKVTNQEDEDDDASPAAKSTQGTLIYTSFKNEKKDRENEGISFIRRRYGYRFGGP